MFPGGEEVDLAVDSYRLQALFEKPDRYLASGFSLPTVLVKSGCALFFQTA